MVRCIWSFNAQSTTEVIQGREITPSKPQTNKSPHSQRLTTIMTTADFQFQPIRCRIYHSGFPVPKLCGRSLAQYMIGHYWVGLGWVVHGEEFDSVRLKYEQKKLGKCDLMKQGWSFVMVVHCGQRNNEEKKDTQNPKTKVTLMAQEGALLAKSRLCYFLPSLMSFPFAIADRM